MNAVAPGFMDCSWCAGGIPCIAYTGETDIHDCYPVVNNAAIRHYCTEQYIQGLSPVHVTFTAFT